MTDQVAAEGTTESVGAAAEGTAAPTAGTATPNAPSEATASPASDGAPSPEKSILGTEPEKKPEGEPEKKPEEAKAAEPIDPKSYKVEFPEGLKPDDAGSTKFLDAAAKAGLSNDAVQALVKEMGPEFSQMSKLANEYASAVQKFQDMNASWQSECKSDPEFGGAKLQDTVAMVRQAWESTLSPDHVKSLTEALDLTGAGNHPAILRAFHALASRISEGGPVQGRPAAGARSAAEIMYPNQARAS